MIVLEHHVSSLGHNELTRLTHSSLGLHICINELGGSPLVQVRACFLFSTKVLPKPILSYYHLEQNSMKFVSKWEKNLSRSCISSCDLWDDSHSVQTSIWSLYRNSVCDIQLLCRLGYNEIVIVSLKIPFQKMFPVIWSSQHFYWPLAIRPS